MSAGIASAQFERLIDSLSAAATGAAPWRPALEALLLLAHAARPGDEALLASALRQTSRALAVHASRPSSSRRASAPEAATS